MAFGCVFATGEFGGALAFYAGWFITDRTSLHFQVVFLIGGALASVALVGIVLTWWLDRNNNSAAIKRAARVTAQLSARDRVAWALRVPRSQTSLFWLSFWQVAPQEAFSISSTVPFVLFFMLLLVVYLLRSLRNSQPPCCGWRSQAVNRYRVIQFLSAF